MRIKQIQKIANYIKELNSREHSSFVYCLELFFDHINVNVEFRLSQEERSSACCLEIHDVMVKKLRRLIPYQYYFIRATEDGKLFIRFFFKKLRRKKK